jgi:hypothetical protein
MTKRKAIGKKLRFEVFKRDKFCCQYCGQKAPEVVLVCDHISPVAEGGETTLLNLITACEGCNSGKGARTLDDATAVAKQRAELERLAERREQIDMMLQWSRGLEDTKNSEIDALCDRAADFFSPFHINEKGRHRAKKWLKNFGLEKLLSALETAAEQYLKYDENEKVTQASVELAWSKIPGIARLMALPQDERELYYVRGILRNRLSYLNEYECIRLLRESLAMGYSINWLKEEARTARSWTQWSDTLYRLLEEDKCAKQNAPGVES